jgi:hypothetical protein
MLRLSAEVVTVEPDGRDAPTLSLVGEKRRDPTGTIDHDGPFRRGNRPLDAVHSEPTGLFFPRKRASWPAIWGKSVKNRSSLARERL